MCTVCKAMAGLVLLEEEDGPAGGGTAGKRRPPLRSPCNLGCGTRKQCLKRRVLDSPRSEPGRKKARARTPGRYGGSETGRVRDLVHLNRLRVVVGGEAVAVLGGRGVEVLNPDDDLPGAHVRGGR